MERKTRSPASPPAPRPCAIQKYASFSSRFVEATQRLALLERTANCSSRHERDAHRFGADFAVLQPIRKNAKGQCFDRGESVSSIFPVREHAGKVGYRADPTAVVLAFQLDTKMHEPRVADKQSI